MEHNQGEEQHLLTGFEDNIVRAGSGKRFANYLIDIFFFYLVIFVTGMVVIILNPGMSAETDESTGYDFTERVIGLLFYALFMFAQEALFKGKSLGKLITGTRAVNLDGSRINIKTALFRGLSRAVPFSAFSALGTPCNPWHDRWTDTLVIDEKQSSYNTS